MCFAANAAGVAPRSEPCGRKAVVDVLPIAREPLGVFDRFEQLHVEKFCLKDAVVALCFSVLHTVMGSMVRW